MKHRMFVQSSAESSKGTLGQTAAKVTGSIDLSNRDIPQTLPPPVVGGDVDAQAIATQLRSLLAQVEQGCSTSARCFADVASDWLIECEATRKPTTLKGLRIFVRDLVSRSGDRSIEGSWRPVAVQLLAEYKDTPAAAQHRIVTLAAILRWACARGYRSTAPDFRDLEKVYKAPRRRPYAPEHLRRILAACDERDSELRLLTAPVIRLLVWCPLRASEACGLRWSDIDMPGRRIRLRDSKVGPRVVPFGTEAAAVLEAQGKSKGPVFRGSGEGSVAYQSAFSEFVRVLNWAQIDWGSLHFLRHSWATISSRLGISTAVRAEVLGHSTRGMTDQVYTHVTDEDLDDAVSRVEAAILGRRYTMRD